MEKPVNIVMIGPFGMQPLGTMRVRALPLARALVARGHKVAVLLPPWQNPADAGRVWQDAGVQVENMDLPRRIPGWFHLRLTSALVRRAQVLDPDVVHVFKPKAYAGLAHMALKKRYPVVLDTDDWEGPGGWNDINPYPSPLKRFFAWQERWGLVHAGAVTVASRALQTLVWTAGGDPGRVFYLPNGVILPEQTAEASPKTGRPTVLLYTRFFEFEIERLWRILLNVRSQVPHVQVLVVGQGFFGEETSLLTRARDAGWRVAESSLLTPEDDLIYTGLGTPDNLPHYFARADLALYPFDDTLVNRTKCPVKLLDLMAAGIPVVADAVGEIAQVIQHGVSGCLIPSGDDEAFAAAVTALITHPAQRQEMAAQAARDMRERFAWDRLALTAEQAYAYVHGVWNSGI
jgi:glycosyltransferase involved in cell wall biosynthesis